jgi:hypothetical protein
MGGIVVEAREAINMGRYADNLSYGDEPATQRVIPPEVLNSMVAACGIVRRVAYLMNVNQLEQQPRSPSPVLGTTGDSEPDLWNSDVIYQEVSVEDLFKDAIGSLGLSIEEVVELWDLFLSASAGAKRHYQRLVSEQRHEPPDDVREPAPPESTAIKMHDRNQERT